jgi:hypothetical protein
VVSQQWAGPDAVATIGRPWRWASRGKSECANMCMCMCMCKCKCKCNGGLMSETTGGGCCCCCSCVYVSIPLFTRPVSAALPAAQCCEASRAQRCCSAAYYSHGSPRARPHSHMAPDPAAIDPFHGSINTMLLSRRLYKPASLCPGLYLADTPPRARDLSCSTIVHPSRP